LSRPTRCEDRRAVAGFTLIEVLIALAIVAVALTAIGSLMATTVRGTRSIDQRLALVETARAIEAGLPDRGDLAVGSLTGAVGGYRWQINVVPFRASFIDLQRQTPWVPQAVVITVQSPAGQILRIDSVRLRRRISG
jgi:general secretion pathway protein I